MTSTGGPVIARQRLYLTQDKSRAVPEGHPDAWTLFCTPGSEMPRAQAARYGLLDPEPEQPAPGGETQDDPEQPEPKARAASTKPRTARTKPRGAGAVKRPGSEEG